jgi:2-methylcitrate dehydratase PrpD
MGDPELTLARPEGQSNIEVFTKNGSKLEKRVTTFRGKADNPLTSDEIAAKARELMTPVLGEDRTGQLIDYISHLENLGSMRDLRPLLSA